MNALSTNLDPARYNFTVKRDWDGSGDYFTIAGWFHTLAEAQAFTLTLTGYAPFKIEYVSHLADVTDF